MSQQHNRTTKIRNTMNEYIEKQFFVIILEVHYCTPKQHYSNPL